MKLHQTENAALNTVTGYGNNYVDINHIRYEWSIIVQPEGPICKWHVSSFDFLTVDHFDLLVNSMPEVVIFGSGIHLRFPSPTLIFNLIINRIGVETMDFQAACRTYNILISEGRNVIAALLIEH
ncbi:MAG: Mth938-like domain-containing protein [Burkholderia sp.]|nr:Mth938-like domain-containing protein [Burkholderia sp.]